MSPATEKETQRILSLDRETATEELLHARSTFPLDFTKRYIETLPLDRIRHLLLALFINNTRRSSII